MSMHTTTVRFGGETWSDLKAVCDRDGIATAQYIREATIARLALSGQTPRNARIEDELDELRGRVERLEHTVSRQRWR